MCCSTGICGPELDPELVNFAVTLSQLSKLGVTVERYNLGQQPLPFAENAEVKAILDKDGMEGLPLIFEDDQLRFKGRYPDARERSSWVALATDRNREEAVS
jgi:hypothetical protein